MGQPGQAGLQHLRRLPSGEGANWRYRNWGSRHNAADFEMLTDEAGRIEFRFDAMNGDAAPIFHKIAKRFPDLFAPLHGVEDCDNYALSGIITAGRYVYERVDYSDALYVLGDDEEPPPYPDDEPPAAAAAQVDEGTATIWLKSGYLHGEWDPTTGEPRQGTIPPGMYWELAGTFDRLKAHPMIVAMARASIVSAGTNAVPPSFGVAGHQDRHRHLRASGLVPG